VLMLDERAWVADDQPADWQDTVGRLDEALRRRVGRG
jgi:hypothetical protein